VYSYAITSLEQNVKRFVSRYNAEVGRHPGCGTQCFPFYTYAEDGTHRRENIIDWALEQFRSHYHDPSITKRDIFHYIYAVLHHPEYRERYTANLRPELPRILFASATPNVCHSEPANAGEEPAVPASGNAAGKQQIPPSGRNDIIEGSDETLPSANSSPGGAADNSPGRKPSVDQKKENHSTLPKAVAAERSSQATDKSLPPSTNLPTTESGKARPPVVPPDIARYARL
jgi:hypothetical protein